jgi:uncharacterized protein (DUF58 family)
VRRLLFRALRAISTLDRWLKARLTRGGWLALGIGGAAAAAGLDTNQTVTYRAFTFLAALLLVAWLASLTLRARVTARRELPRYATAGERCVYRVVLANEGRRGLRGGRLEERFGDPRPTYDEWRRAREPGEARRNWWDRNVGYFRWRWLIERRLPRDVDGAALAPIAPGERREFSLAFTPRRRGRIAFTGMAIAQPDPLGLVNGLTRVPLEAKLIALPKRYRLPSLALPGRRKFQPGGVSLVSSVGDSEEFLALRDYRPGDPLQRVHWKSLARTRKLVVKEYQDEFFERHALVLDTASPRGEDEAFEEAVALAASFVYTIDTQECLLDLLFVGGTDESRPAQGPGAVPPVRSYTAGRGQMQSEHMLEALSAVGPSVLREFGALASAVLARRATLSSVFLILLAWDDERKRLAAALQASGAEVRALLVCERDAAPAGAPPWLLALHPGEVELGLAKLR